MQVFSAANEKNEDTDRTVTSPDESTKLKILFHVSQQKHLLWVLKRAVSLRRFFRAPKTHDCLY